MLILTLAVSLGTLFFFKYFNFVSGSIADVSDLLSIPIHPVTIKVLLPVGISFYTFQTLGYVIDVYRGDVRAERHLGRYAAFIMFFPQLVAGPIERTERFLPQIREGHPFYYGQAVYGLRLMLWGFFKKLVIADRLAVYVDLVYDDIYLYKGLPLAVSSVFFAFQIYCDFSGYSDIAIGVAKLFGIDLMTNFKSPYLSASIKEFWSRWHISLSSWFRDYVYIPLGGNRRGKYRTYVNRMVTFLTSGLWHGASFNFIVWGGVHGSLQIIEDISCKKRIKKRREGCPWGWLCSIVLVFLIVCICWVFFRAGTVQEAVYVIGHMFDGIGQVGTYIWKGYHDMQLNKTDVSCIMISLIFLIFYDYISLETDVILLLDRLPRALRWCIYYLLVIIIISFGEHGSTQFVYFQF